MLRGNNHKYEIREKYLGNSFVQPFIPLIKKAYKIIFTKNEREVKKDQRGERHCRRNRGWFVRC